MTDDKSEMELHPFLTRCSGNGEYYVKASFRTMDQMHRAAEVITKALLDYNAATRVLDEAAPHK